MSLHSLLLAAGRGSRFGAATKQLAEIAGQPMLSHSLQLAEAITPGQVTLVLGYQHERLRSLAGQAQPVFNPDWESGLGSSIAAGIAALPASASGVLLLLCDQVAITAHDLRQLVDRYQQACTLGAAGITCSAYGHHPDDNNLGVPAIFPRQYFTQLRSLRGDQGAKALLYQNPVIRLPLPAATIDLDTQAQWRTFTTSQALTLEGEHL